MVTVNMESDNTYTYSLPGGIPGNIYIRVRDHIRTADTYDISSVNIDEMFISSTGPTRVILGIDHYSTPSYVEPSWGSGIPPSAEFSLPLKAGWNMISVPLNMTDTTLANILSDISGNYRTVWAYDSGDPVDSWKIYGTDKTPGNDLANIYREDGIWIFMTAPDTLTISTYNSHPTVTNIQLKKGWNFVGYPSMTAKNAGTGVGDAFASISAYVDMAIHYNASDTLDHWKEWGAGTQGDLVQIDPGYGLWMHVSSDCVWSVEWLGP
jgi:hypothetical protein